MTCSECGKELEIGSWPYCPHEPVFESVAQRFSPIVIHRDSQGNVRLPAHSDAPVPPGFQKVELTDFHQVRKFEREMNSREDAKAQEHTHNRLRAFDAQMRENREAMAAIRRKFSARGQRFYDAMRKASEARQEEMHRKGYSSSNFFVEALSMDSSNRERHRDSRNEWGKMRGKD